MKYTPSGEDNRKHMLESMGISNFEELIRHIPDKLIDRDIGLDEGISEYELQKRADDKAAANRPAGSMVNFAGMGIYDHYIPPQIKHIAMRPEFYTAYTPYQAEVSQGTLQIIYEYQSMISELYNMEISNASMYDGSTSTAEACHMAMGITGKKKILISQGLHFTVREVIDTYLKGQDIEYHYIPMKNGITDKDKLSGLIDDSTAGIIIQNPNLYGFIEDMDSIAEMVSNSKALFIVSQNPVSTGLIKPAGDYDADIAVGEGQPLGLHMAFGGPLLGIFTAREKYARRMPGRIIGKTEDEEGRTGYVMTLQTREQHIRREKATSNICTNEGLCLLMSAAYMELTGRRGFRQVSADSAASAHYLNEQLRNLNGIEMINADSPFFNEFPVRINNLNDVYSKMKSKGYLMGVKMNRFIEDEDSMIVMASTEKNSKNDIDNFITELKGVLK